MKFIHKINVISSQSYSWASNYHKSESWSSHRSLSLFGFRRLWSGSWVTDSSWSFRGAGWNILFKE